MKIYWLWLAINMSIWVLAIQYIDQSLTDLTIKIFGLAFYFAFFFIIPLYYKKQHHLFIILSAQVVLAAIILFPVEQQLNAYFLLTLTLILAEGFYRLPLQYAAVLSMVVGSSLILHIYFSQLGTLNSLFVGSYFVLMIAGLTIFKNISDRLHEIDSSYQAMVSEYRDLKRRNISEEEIARQDERVLIAHEIHDSVGHKLTALLMQLEMFRLKTPRQNQSEMNTLKELAEGSLEETRSAVRSLKTTDTGGLPGIMRLIRKLERESFMNIHFSVKHGAFNAPLTGEQSFVIYRVVQEALTNMMKHSEAKEASIHFEAPGGSVFRFQISNPTTDRNTRFKEGFGLSSMRERLEKHEGMLEIYKTTKEFVISGYMKIGYGGEASDSNPVGGRPSDGTPGPENDD